MYSLATSSIHVFHEASPPEIKIGNITRLFATTFCTCGSGTKITVAKIIQITKSISIIYLLNRLKNIFLPPVYNKKA